MKNLIITILILAVIILAAFLYAEDSIEAYLPEWLVEIEHGIDDDDGDEDDDDDDDGVNGKQQLVDGSLVVKIDSDVQQLAGIKTILTENINVQSEERAFATVIDINELLTMRSEYRDVLAQREITNTRLKSSAKLLDQLNVLHKEATNISKRELQNARAKWEEDRARVEAANIKLQNIRANMMQKWNAELTGLALKEESEIFDRLIQRKEYLVLMTLKANQQMAMDTAFVFVNRLDERNKARKAYFISAAPFSDTSLQGETYFLRTNAEKMRIGMRLYVWLPETGFSGEGVNIPEEAVVWYAGKPWAYIQVDEEQFSRRSLIDPIETTSGWLVKDNFQIGEKIVISGAQTLLSEEFKWAIPDEDDD